MLVLNPVLYKDLASIKPLGREPWKTLCGSQSFRTDETLAIPSNESIPHISCRCADLTSFVPIRDGHGPEEFEKPARQQPQDVTLVRPSFQQPWRGSLQNVLDWYSVTEGAFLARMVAVQAQVVKKKPTKKLTIQSQEGRVERGGAEICWVHGVSADLKLLLRSLGVGGEVEMAGSALHARISELRTSRPGSFVQSGSFQPFDNIVIAPHRSRTVRLRRSFFPGPGEPGSLMKEYAFLVLKAWVH